MIKLSDDTCKMINAYENGACLDGINKWMLSGFVIRFISFSSSFLERVIVRQIVRIGRRIENGSIRSKIVQNVIKMSFVLFKKEKSSNLLRPGISTLCSVRTNERSSSFSSQGNCTQEKGRKEMTGGCTMDECA